MHSIYQQCEKAFNASFELATLSTDIKNKALYAMSDRFLEQEALVLSENSKDVEAGVQSGMSKALLDRLTLNHKRIVDIAEGIRMIATLPDPIGEILGGSTRPNGLRIVKVRVPLGVIGMIYEARPNVTADAIALALKTSNAVVLRGSSSTYRSNVAITTILRNAAASVGVPVESIQLLENVSREGVTEFVQLKQFLSVIIPRGGADLIQRVVTSSQVPTIETGVGNCHIFVDKDANLDHAIPILLNAKVQRPSACNACESLLVHQDIAPVWLPKAIQALQKAGVDIRGCAQTQALAPHVIPAQESDWGTEFLDLVLSVKVVANVQEAITHIRQYGTHHSEAILSENLSAVTLFQQQVDAAAVLVNASTRFVDGGEFGFGAEMGISSQKLHARGPMGLPELTTYKYIVTGEGQIRS